MYYREPEFRVSLEVFYDAEAQIEGATGIKHYVGKTLGYSINAHCPFCNVYSSFIINSYYEKNPDTYPHIIDFICSCPNLDCEKTIFVVAQHFPCPVLTFPRIIKRSNEKGKILNIYPDTDRKIEVSNDIADTYRYDYYMAQKALDISPRLSFLMTKYLMRNYILSQLYFENEDESKYDLKTLIDIFIEGYINSKYLIEQKLIDYKLADELKNFEVKEIGIYPTYHEVRTNEELERYGYLIPEEYSAILEYEKSAALTNLNILFRLFNTFYTYPKQRKRFEERMEEKANSENKNPPID